MKFYGPLLILLTAFSPNLEANSIDPINNLLKYPYELDLRLFNVNSGLARISWEGTTVDFRSYDPASDVLRARIKFMQNGKLFADRSFNGELSEDGVLRTFTVFPYIGTVWKGRFSDDFMQARGRLDGIGTSDMTGIWTLTAVDLPAAVGLFVCALGTIPLFARRRTS